MALPIKSRNAAHTREAILGAARNRFMLDGYDHAGLRAIAADAGVDPALICRYFGAKELLFAEVLAGTGRDPMEVIAGERGEFGRRLSHALLKPSDRHPERMAFVQLAIRSSTSPVASRLVRDRIQSHFIEPFAAWVGGERAEEKAWLAGSILMGVATMLAVGSSPAGSVLAGGMEPAAALPSDSIVEQLALLLQGVIDDDQP